jgi:hypothetical protein
MAMLLTHSQVLTSGLRSSGASERTLSISHIRDDRRSIIWTLIYCVLRHTPSATVRSISEEVGVSHETVHRRCTESLQVRPRLLKWVPPFLTCDLKRKHLELAKELLGTVLFEQRALLHETITGDEFWFYLDYSGDRIWTCANDDVPQRVSHQIQSEKVMLEMLWSTRGPVLVKWMERGHRFKTTYSINEIIHRLVTNLKAKGKFPHKRWSIVGIQRVHLSAWRSKIDVSHITLRRNKK